MDVLRIERVERRGRRAAVTGLVALVALTGLVAAACSTSTDGSGETAGAVVATTSILADITSNVACGKVEVASVIPLGADAHEFEPGVRDADRMRSASLVIANGLGLEEGLRDTLQAVEEDGAHVLEVGPHVRPRTTDGAEDPHVWMDPDRMAEAVPLIADRLVGVHGLAVTPAEIRRCAADYRQRLLALGREMDATLAVVPSDRRKLVTNHESLGYFADRFDFDVIGAAIPSTSSLGESNPRDLDELAATIRRAGVPAVFAETTQPRAVASALAERVGEVDGQPVRVETLYTESLGRRGSDGATYVGMLRSDAAAIAAALAPAGTAPATGTAAATGAPASAGPAASAGTAVAAH
jgi:zinc/manganese transport system substrate-binding protein